VDFSEYEIKGRLKIVYTSRGKLIYITDSSGSELGKVNLCDGVDLSYFLRELESDGELERN